MIIKPFKVTRLNQNKDWCFDLSFNQDINILTGKNVFLNPLILIKKYIL